MSARYVVILGLLVCPILNFPTVGVEASCSERPKTGLVLSGGGARGFAHIVVLRALEEANVPIDMIAGTSMGAIVGGLYASGNSVKRIEVLAKNMDYFEAATKPTEWRSILPSRRYAEAKTLLRIEFDGLRLKLPPGILPSQKIDELLFEHTARASFDAAGDFDRLEIPFRAVAVDLTSGERIVIGEGGLARAIRSSMALPFAISPVEHEGRVLMDGGIVDNLPADVVREMGADVVIGVDVSGIGERAMQFENGHVGVRAGVALVTPAGPFLLDYGRADDGRGCVYLAFGYEF